MDRIDPALRAAHRILITLSTSLPDCPELVDPISEDVLVLCEEIKRLRIASGELPPPDFFNPTQVKMELV